MVPEENPEAVERGLVSFIEAACADMPAYGSHADAFSWRSRCSRSLATSGWCR